MNSKRIFKAAACLLIACALMLSMCSCAFWKKTFAKPNEYMAYVEEEAVAVAVDSFVESYDKVIDSYTGTKSGAAKGELQIGVGSSITQLLKSYTGMDFDWINDTKITFNGVGGKDAMSYAMSLVLGDDTLVSLDTIADMSGKGLYIKISELTKKYLFVDFEKDLGITPETAKALDTEALLEKLPEGKVLGDLVLKYIGIVFDNINEAEKTKGSVSANGKSEECTVLEAELDEGELKVLAKEFLFELQKDEAIEELIRTFVGIFNETAASEEEKLDADEVYAEFVGEVNDAIDDIDDDDTDDDDKIVIRYTNYVNSDSKVIARKLWAYEIGEVFIGTAYEENEFGAEIYLKEYYDDEEEFATVFEIKGEGTSDKGVVNGEFDIYSSGELMVTLEVSDLDEKALEKDQLKGSFIVYPSAKLFETDETGMLSLIGSSLSIGMDLDCNKDKQSVKFFVNSMENELFSVKMTSEYVDGTDVTVPSESETAEDIEAWLDGASFDTFIANFKESDLPAEITAIIEQLVSMLSY